jgi:hypothetical protein
MDSQANTAQEGTEQRQRDIADYLRRREAEKDQLAARLTSLQAQLMRASNDGQRGRLREQIRAREDQLKATAAVLDKDKTRAAKIIGADLDASSSTLCESPDKSTLAAPS